MASDTRFQKLSKQLHPRNLIVFNESHAWKLVLAPLVTSLIGFFIIFAIAFYVLFVGQITLQTLLTGLSAASIIIFLGNVALPIGLYYDISYVHSLSVEWNPSRKAYVAVAFASVFAPLVADPLALVYLYQRVEHTDLGKEHPLGYVLPWKG